MSFWFFNTKNNVKVLTGGKKCVPLQSKYRGVEQW